jgi:hypothetical protein
MDRYRSAEAEEPGKSARGRDGFPKPALQHEPHALVFPLSRCDL